MCHYHIQIEGNTTERVADAGTNFDHISSVAELDDWDVNGEQFGLLPSLPYSGKVW